MSTRAFRISPAEPVPDEVRRVARGRIDHAIDELRCSSESSREEAVHEARKDMKKLRALLRLVRGELGERVYSAENACFRDVARELAGVRDADVMLATLTDLEQRYGELPGAGGYRLMPWTWGSREEDRAEVTELSGTPEVPILVLDDGEVISGSGEIASWAKQHPAARA